MTSALKMPFSQSFLDTPNAIRLLVELVSVVARHSCFDFPELHMKIQPDTMRGRILDQ